jgi:hypothetical protein
MSGRVWTRIFSLAAGLLAVVGTVGPSRSAGFFEKNFYLSGPRYSSNVPLCSESGPLARIQKTFRTKEDRFWQSDLEIVDFKNVHEVALRPWVAGTIPRRFCSADALVSDGVKRRIYYSIIEDGGFFSVEYGVEWCVVGLDRNWAYNPHCKEARP